MSATRVSKRWLLRAAWLLTALAAAGAQAQINTQASPNGLRVSTPNGYVVVDREDLAVQTTAGAVRWMRTWNGLEWTFNPHWESLSSSWRNLTGSQTADTTEAALAIPRALVPANNATLGAGSGEGCWVWVDEDWQPSAAIISPSGIASAGPMQPERTQPFNRTMGDAINASYSDLTFVNVDWQQLCAGNTGGNVSGTYQGLRRINELYLGEAGRYTFNNRTLIERRPVKALPAATSAALASGSIALAPIDIANGYRWLDRSGDWIDYNTRGQVVAYGDRNDNKVWMVRDGAGTLHGVVDANGRVVMTLHYSGPFLAEVRDYAVAGNALDLPARTVRYTYDAKNRLDTVTDARGHVVRYGYDDLNRLTQVTDQELRQESLTYNVDIAATRTAADGGVTEYSFAYDDANKQFSSRITGPVTSAGRRVEGYTHNRVGKLQRRSVNGRVELDVRYDTGTRSEVRVNSRGFGTRITKNEFDQIVEIVNEDGTLSKRRWDTRHLELAEETDETGVRHTYERDTKGNLLVAVRAIGLPDERRTTYERNALGQVTVVTRKGRTEANGTVTPDAVWRLEYDALGQISKVTDPENHERLYVFDRAGNLARVTDPTGKSWRYTYDALGNPLTETSPRNRTTTYTNDKVGNLKTATDPLNRTWRWNYDALDRETAQIDPYGAAYTTAFDKAGSVSEVRDASGKGARLDYDALMRLVQATDAKGQTYGLEYAEADGTDQGARRPSKVRYPTFQRTMRYDARERVSLKTDLDGADGRTDGFSYDGVGRRKTATDANGKTRFYDWGPHGQLVQMRDPMGNALTLAYDARGNVIEVTDPNGNKTRMAYDRRNLLVRSTDPLGAITRYAYDNRGWLAEIIQANGQRVEYGYDDDGRVATHREYAADGSTLVKTTTYTHDDANNLTGWNDGSVSAVRNYDDADRLLSETVNHGGFSLTHAYTWHPNGQMKTHTGPDGATVSYDYDGQGQLERVTIPGEGDIAVTEWNWVNPKRVLLPGGSQQQYEFDGYQSLKRLKVTNPGQATVFELQNEFGKLAEIKTASHDGTPLAYAYDDATRLTSVTAATAPGRNETFTLDAASNRSTHSRTGAVTWRYDAANQLTERGSITYEYDAAGNQTKKTDSSLAEPQRTTSYEYDAFNRMTAVRNGAGALIASYTFDPFDRRLSKTLGNGTKTTYLHTGWGLLAEADAAGTVQVNYGWNPQVENGTAPLYARVPDGVGGRRYVYYHNDHLGTPQRITDKTGAVVWAADYDAYGRATVRTAGANPVTNNLRLPGQYFDAETGLHYNDRRSYDPDTGRYTTRDPIGFEGGINLYAYAHASPGVFIDPTGEFVPLLCLAGNYLRCVAICMGISAVTDFVANCGQVNWGDNAKDCALDCVLSMLPVPDPCGKFGKFFGAAMGVLGGLNSFPADTLVHVRPAGAGAREAQLGRAELRPIGQLKPGDEVLALAEWKDPGQVRTDTGDKLDARLAYEKVTHVFASTREQRLVHLTLDNGETITATDGHPLKTPEGWRDAILLKRGGQLLLKGAGGDGDAAGVSMLDASTWAGHRERVATIVEMRVEHRVLPVFNLEVANAHTFFVGERGALAHNSKRGPKPGLQGPHNQTIDELASLIVDMGGELLAGGRRLAEKLIPTPGGVKCGRRPDILYRDRLGQVRGTNVGRTDRHGNPVPRERDALGDLNGPGNTPTTFVPYK